MGTLGRFRRVLVVLDHGHESAETLRVAARWAPQAEYVHCVRLIPPGIDAWRGDPPSAELVSVPSPELVAWRRRRPQMQLDGSWAVAFDGPGLARLIGRLGVDLLVLAPLHPHFSRERAQLALVGSVRDRCHVLSVGQRASVDPARPPSGSGQAKVCAAIDPAGASVFGLASFLRELGSEEAPFGLMVRGERGVALDEVTASFARQLEPPLAVEGALASSANLIDAVHDDAQARGASLIVASLDAAASLDALVLDVVAPGSLDRAVCPVLLLPRSHHAPPLFTERLSVSDGLVLPGHETRLAVERTSAFGPALPAGSERLMLRDRGETIGPLRHADGLVTLPAQLLETLPDRYTLQLELEGVASDSAQATLLQKSKPWILLDSTLDRLPIRSIAARAESFQLVFVRMRRTLGLEENRERLRKYAQVLGVAHLVDAGAWLEDGGAESLPPSADGLRLLRVAERMLMCGARVGAIVTRHRRVQSDSVSVLTERTWAEADLRAERAFAFSPESGKTTLQAELDAFSGSKESRGHRILFELDNAGARRDLMQSIAAAKERIHLIGSLWPGDDVSERLSFALKSAAERGIEVRLLSPVDLNSGDREAALLADLAGTPRLQVGRLESPFQGPSSELPRLRNPLTLGLFDGRRALITGRGLAAPFYRGLEEVRVTAQSECRELPWTGAGLYLQGPMVTQLERWFLDLWMRTGQPSFFVRACAAIGSVSLRLIVHEALRDTHALQAQLSLIRHASRELVLVNTFPLSVELSRALVDALKRGVRVRLLFGNLRPRVQRGACFPEGPFSPLADQLVRASLDPLVRAGADAYEYQVSPPSRWESSLEKVLPMLHAKVLMRDGQDVAIGSAELDAAAAYWEDEVLVIVHDDHFAANVEASLAPLFAGARRVDPQSAAFRVAASQRRWLGHHWPLGARP